MKQKQQLEELVEMLTLAGVLQTLIEICDEKMECLDKITAKAWAQDAAKLDSIADKLNN